MTGLKADSGRRGFLKQLVAVLGAGGLAPMVLAAEQHLVRGLRVERHKGALHLVFDLDSTSGGHKLFSLDKPARVVLDLKRTTLAEGAQLNVSQVDPVVRTRYSARKDNGLRVVFDMDRPVVSRSFIRKGARGRQLVVEIRSKSDSALVAPVAGVDQSPPRPRDLVIAIDAGHGGKDPGAIGKHGTHEKEIVLQVARRLEKLLQREPGYTTVMIRDGDYFLPLRDRVRKARRQQADLFISIHADASPNRKARGSSVYVLSENGASSEAARLLAEQENAVDLIGGISLDDKDEILASVLLDLSQRHTIESSQTAAGDMLSELRKLGQVHSRKVEQAGFAVLKSPDVPSILVETGFISNTSEEKRLRTRDYQSRVAKSLLKGVKRYFASHAPADSLIARFGKREHTIRSGETLSGIASRYRVGLGQLRTANRIKGSHVRVGQILKIPVSGT